MVYPERARLRMVMERAGELSSASRPLPQSDIGTNRGPRP